MAGQIFIYGGIGSNSGEVSLKNVRSQIEQNKSESELVVHIVSPGGDVFEGYGIYNLLKNSGKKITTHIEGLCASISTLIGFAGEIITMNKTSQFMIHNPAISDLKGGSSDLRNVADQLDTIKSQLIEVSMARAIRNGKSITREKLWELYDNETWLTADQALEYGFADQVVDAIKAVATVDLTKFKMKNTLLTKFQNLLNLTKFKNEFTETLADGSIIIVMSEDGDWTGKQVVREDGSPLEAGDYTLVSGKVITVAADSTISTVTEPDSPAAQQQNAEMDNKIKELEAQLAEAKAAKETAEASTLAAKAEAAQATAKAAKFENRVTAIERDFLKLKEEAGKTVGEPVNLPRGPVNKQTSKDDNFDPMGDEVLQYIKSKGLN